MRLLLLILGLMAAAPAAAQSEISAPLGGGSFHMPLPRGYCGIDTAQPIEAKLFEQKSRLAQPQSQLLGIAIECNELAALRNEQRRFGRHLMVKVMLEAKAPIRHGDFERATFLAAVATDLPRLDSKDLAKEMAAKTESVGVSANIQHFGQIARDEAAVYLGTVLAGSTQDAGVAGVTVAGGFAVTVSLHQPFADDGTMRALLDQTRHETRALIAANSPGALPPRDPTPPWRRTRQASLCRSTAPTPRRHPTRWPRGSAVW